MRYTLITLSNVRISTAKRLQHLMLSTCSKPRTVSIMVKTVLPDGENFKLLLEILQEMCLLHHKEGRVQYIEMGTVWLVTVRSKMSHAVPIELYGLLHKLQRTFRCLRDVMTSRSGFGTSHVQTYCHALCLARAQEWFTSFRESFLGSNLRESSL